MAPEDTQMTAYHFVIRAERYYTALLQAVVEGDENRSEGEPSLGGKLLYISNLNEDNRALVVAGNVAGAATLSASADFPVQKQSMREGIVDFLVTSLDEALRILKNEIRKRETVAVCVVGAPEEVEREMLERGVQPDLLGPWDEGGLAAGNFGAASRRISLPSTEKNAHTHLVWQVETEPMRWMAKLDAIAHACLSTGSGAAHRWLRLAPRYCGRRAMGVRVLRCEAAVADEFTVRVNEGIKTGEIGVPVQITTQAV